MIIVKYLIKEVLKSQVSIFLILLIIFICQKLMKIISITINDKVPVSIIPCILTLNIPEIIYLILPLSLALGLIVTINRLYMENEITIMYACGFSKITLINVAIILAFFTSIIAFINLMWIGPLSINYNDKILIKTKNNLNTFLIHGRFQRVIDNRSILFIENISNNNLLNVFIAYLNYKYTTSPTIVIISNYGKLTEDKKDGSTIINLNNGTCFEEIQKSQNFRITNFRNYQAVINRRLPKLDNFNKVEQMDISKLWNTHTKYSSIEFHWRLTLLFSIFIMATMAIPISIFSIRHDKIFSILPSILIYLIFIILQTSIKSNGLISKLNSVYWMWMINTIYLTLSIILNIWDNLTIYLLSIYTEK